MIVFVASKMPYNFFRNKCHCQKPAKHKRNTVWIWFKSLEIIRFADLSPTWAFLKTQNSKTLNRFDYLVVWIHDELFRCFLSRQTHWEPKTCPVDWFLSITMLLIKESSVQRSWLLLACLLMTMKKGQCWECPVASNLLWLVSLVIWKSKDVCKC